MLKNYLKIAFRKLYKNKVDSIISIGGLAVGIACCLLLVAYVQFEWSFDEFHKKADRIYRLYSQSVGNEGNNNASIGTSYPLAAAIEATIPEAEEVVRWRRSGAFVEIDGKFKIQRIYLAEPDFFDIFSFPLIAGSPDKALAKPNSIVITQQKAIQIFGTDDVLGKSLMLRQKGKKQLFAITGVAANIPDNSTIYFEVMLPYANNLLKLDKRLKESWYMGVGGTYVMLHENADRQGVHNKLQDILSKNLNKNFAEHQRLKLLLLPKMHFSSVSADNPRAGNPLYAWILACLALVILAIAAINFMSLSLSRASTRSNEIGLRKMIGATRGKLLRQFMGEAFLTCLIAFLLAGVLAELAMPWFQQLIDTPITLGLINNPVVWGVLIGLLLLTTMITGGYPALVLSKKKGSTAFNSRTTSGKIPVFVKGLIVVQFSLAITFLSIAFIMYNQLHYMQSKDLGYASDDVIAIDFMVRNKKAMQKAKIYRREAKRLGGVQNAALTGAHYRGLKHGAGMAGWRASTSLKGFEGHTLIHEQVDKFYLKTMDIKLKRGRNFQEIAAAERENSIIVNELFVETMGWEQPVGQIIHDESKNQTWTAPMNNKKVIGVMENYHFQSLYNKLRPLILTPFSTSTHETPGTILIEYNTNNISQVLGDLSSLWNKILPKVPFSYSFMDDLIAAQYTQEQRWSSIMALASAIAILLACFGLFGLASMAVRRRTKEIGIRKVFGASLTNITKLLSIDFLRLVLIGFVIAVPIAWYSVHQWLQDFAYRIDIGIGIFLLAGGLAVLIALATVSWQSVRAALANPVDSLRSE